MWCSLVGFKITSNQHTKRFISVKSPATWEKLCRQFFFLALPLPINKYWAGLISVGDWAVVAAPGVLTHDVDQLPVMIRKCQGTEVKQNLKEQQLLRQPFWCLLLPTGLWQHHNLGMTQHDYPPFRDVERLRIWKISIFAMGTTISAMIPHHFNLSWDGRNQF